jgi:hypothetical protein
LLFGILALQMEFITREALVAAMHAWFLDKCKPLGQVLVEQSALRADQRTPSTFWLRCTLNVIREIPPRVWQHSPTM